MTLAEGLVVLPMGLLAGALAGLLGIGGGLIFAPLLLWMGLTPHQALATSTFAIVPTAIGGSFTHWRSRSLPLKPGLVIGVTAFATALIFSRLGGGVAGWHLLALQALFIWCWPAQSEPIVRRLRRVMVRIHLSGGCPQSVLWPVWPEDCLVWEEGC